MVDWGHGVVVVGGVTVVLAGTMVVGVVVAVGVTVGILGIVVAAGDLVAFEATIVTLGETTSEEEHAVKSKRKQKLIPNFFIPESLSHL